MAEESEIGAEIKSMGITHIKVLVDNHNNSTRFYYYYALIMFLLGLVVVVTSVLGFFGEDLASDILKIGGVFVTGLSAFPIKEIVNRKEKNGVLKLISVEVESNPKALVENEMLRQMLYEYLKSVVTSK
jgi:hypothetical protein